MLRYIVNQVTVDTESLVNRERMDARIDIVERLFLKFNKDCMEFKNTVNSVKVMGGKNKDKYKPGPIRKGPSSYHVGKRNWAFFNVLKEYASLEPNQGGLRKIRELIKKHTQNPDYLENGLFKRLPTKTISFPKSGWFSFPIVMIERAVVLMPKYFNMMKSKINKMDDTGDKDLSKYLQGVEYLVNTTKNIIAVETWEFALKLKK